MRICGMEGVHDSDNLFLCGINKMILNWVHNFIIYCLLLLENTKCNKTFSQLVFFFLPKKKREKDIKSIIWAGGGINNFLLTRLELYISDKFIVVPIKRQRKQIFFFFFFFLIMKNFTNVTLYHTREES